MTDQAEKETPPARRGRRPFARKTVRVVVMLFEDQLELIPHRYLRSAYIRKAIDHYVDWNPPEEKDL